MARPAPAPRWRVALALLALLEAAATEGDSAACEVQLQTAELAREWVPHASLLTCEALKLSGAPLGADITKLLPLLSRSHVTKLELNGQALRDSDVKLLATSLRAHPTLRTLHLSHNLISSMGAVALSTLLTSATLTLRPR